jgi:hypothetical protein
MMRRQPIVLTRTSIDIPARGGAKLVALAPLAACLIFAGLRTAQSRAADRKPLSAADEAVVAAHLKDAFDAGFVVGPKRLPEAQKHLAQARRAAPADPRIDFANGLVLVKQGKMPQAVIQFEAAIERNGAAYWPAWQAAIWAHLNEKQYESGLKRLAEFAAIVHKAEKPDEISEVQREAARWVGQLLEAVAHVPESRKYDDLLAEYHVKVLDTLGDTLSQSLEEGRELIRARQFELEQAAGSARSTAEKKKALRDQDKSDKLDKDIEGANQEKEDAKKTEQEWKKWLDDMLAASDKQLGLLDRDYQFLDQRAQSLFRSYTLAGTQLTAMNLSLTPANMKGMDSFTLGNLNQQLIAIQNQMLGYQLEYNATLERMSEVAQRGERAMQQRAEGIKRYEDETGQLVKKKADLDKWSARMKAEKQKLTAQKPVGKAGKKGALDKKQQFLLKSILPLNLEHERDQLLASFGLDRANTAAPAK